MDIKDNNMNSDEYNKDIDLDKENHLGTPDSSEVDLKDDSIVPQAGPQTSKKILLAPFVDPVELPHTSKAT